MSTDTTIGVLLREPFRLATAELHRRFAEHGHPHVRAPHGNVLQFLDAGGTRVGVLAELVAHLEGHGYVERIPDPADRRARLVRATARGEEVYAIARAFVVELEGRWAGRMAPGHMEQLRALLAELNGVL